MDVDNIIIRNNTEANRFEAVVGDEIAVIEYKMRDENTIVYTHTGVPESLSGQGLASKMAVVALDYARSENLRVIPLCPFVAGYIHKHPEYKDLLRPRKTK